MSTQLQQKLAAFRNNQMKLQTRAVEDAKRKQAAAARQKAKPKPKPAAADSKKAAAAGGKRPAALGKRLKDVLEWLRAEREPRSAAEIRDGTGNDLDADAALLEALRGNPKIQATSDGLFQYQSLHEIQDPEALLTALVAAGERGLVQADVADSYPGIVEDIAKLARQHKLYAVHNHDLRGDVLYPRDEKMDALVTPISELMSVWREIEVPSEPVELEQALRAAGIAPAKRDMERKRAAPPPREKKRRKQRVRLDKVTNAHMPELFLGEAPVNIETR